MKTTHATDVYRKMIVLFIKDCRLPEDEKVISLDADINILSGSNDATLRSQVHILSLPDMMAVYINDSIEQLFDLPETYNTLYHQFDYSGKGPLKIHLYQHQLSIAIYPVQTSDHAIAGNTII